MTSKRWDTVVDLFHAAREKPPEKRSAFLDAACGSDIAIRDQVQQLLDADLADNFLDEQKWQPIRSKLELQPPAWLGKTVGRYTVTGVVGRGGMGEVFSARDTELDRTVALKFLSPELAGQRSAVDRSIREAKAASALNHPNIVTVYEVIHVDSGVAIAMELVDGTPLRELCGTPAPMETVLHIGRQVAQALAVAHSAGIIHRDIKPENIMVRRDTYVKVLDFGLARRVGGEDVKGNRSSGIPASADETGCLSSASHGTLRYMSPEQYRGDRLTSATDLFSLGIVLYELSTAKHPFATATELDSANAMANTQPTSPSHLNPKIPSAFEALILRMLDKNPATRPTAEAVSRELAGIGSASPLPAPKTEVEVGKWAGKGWAWIAGLGILLTLAATLVVWRMRAPEQTPPAHLEASPLTAYDGIEMQPSFSPDGSQIVFTWNGGELNNYDIYRKVIGTASPVRLTNDAASEFDPVWSPDGKQIAFCRHGQGIFVIPSIGGGERKLFEDPNVWFVGYPDVSLAARRLAWSPNGKWLTFARGASPGGRAGIFVIAAQGGPAKHLTETDVGEVWAPAFSPDGRSLAFARCANPSSCSIAEAPFDPESTGLAPVRPVTKQSGYVGSIAWTPDAQTMIFSQTEFGASTLRLWSVPVRNADRPQLLEFAGPGSDSVALSRSGSRLAYSYFYGDADLWKLERGVAARSSLSSTRRDDSPQISPDGRRIAFSSARAGHQEIWVASVEGKDPVQLTTSRASGTARWSPDGKRIVYDTQAADGLWDICLVDASGGEPVCPVRHPADDKAPSFSRDGKWVYFSSNRDGRDEIYRVAVTGGQPIRLTDNGGYIAWESADGTSIHYTKTGIGCTPLFTRSLAGGAERQVVDSVCERGFVVTAGGIYLIRSKSTSENREIVLLDPTSGKTHVLAAGVEHVDLGLTVSPDGKTVFFSASTQYGADLMLVDGFR